MISMIQTIFIFSLTVIAYRMGRNAGAVIGLTVGIDAGKTAIKEGWGEDQLDDFKKIMEEKK